MVHFAPNIYIQQYLEKTGQLLPDIRAKAQGFLQSGEWHPDPPPGRDTQPPPHSTWLPWAREECPVPVSCRRVPAGAAVQTRRRLLQRLREGRSQRQHLVRALQLHPGLLLPPKGSPALTPGPVMCPWLQADGICPQVLRAGPRLRGHRGAAHHGRAAVAAEAPEEERLLPQRGQTLQQRPAGGAAAAVGTRSVVWAVAGSLCWCHSPAGPVSRCPPAGRCLGRALALGLRDGSDAGAGAAHAGEDGPSVPTGAGGVGTAAGTGDWPFQATAQPELGTAGLTGQRWGL